MPVPEYLPPIATNWPHYPDGAGWYPSFGPHPFTPLGGHNSVVLISNTLTLSPPDGTTEVLIQILDVNCRFTLDGTAPTSTTGFQLLAGDAVIISISRSTIIKVVGESAGASVEYQFGK